MGHSLFVPLGVRRAILPYFEPPGPFSCTYLHQKLLEIVNITEFEYCYCLRLLSPTLRFRCLPHQIGRLVTRSIIFHSRDCGGSDSPLCCLPSTSRSPPLFAPTVSHFQPVPSRQKTSRTISLMSVSSFQSWCSMQMRLCPNHDICPRLDVNGHAPFGMSVFPESYVFRKIA